jgi:hypothetical protein
MLDLTGGESLKTNIALVLNNARLAARIATLSSLQAEVMSLRRARQPTARITL